MLSPLQSMNMHKHNRWSDDAQERVHASHLFDRMVHVGRIKRFRAALRPKSRQLKSFAARTESIIDQHYLGVQTVCLDCIRGTENRNTEFDMEFYPQADHLEERWVRVAVANLKGVKLPPVELLLVGEIYYVRDGHHRISVARAMGQYEIDAVVIKVA